MIHVQPKDYEIIAAFGIIIDFVALMVILAAFPTSPGDDFVLLGFWILCLLVFLGFTGLLQGAARILKIENRRLLFSAFIAFTSLVIFFGVLSVDFLGPYLDPYQVEPNVTSSADRLAHHETYRAASRIFASVIMWIPTAGMAKFMYRTKWFKALLVSLPLPLLIVVIFLLVLG